MPLAHTALHTPRLWSAVSITVLGAERLLATYVVTTPDSSAVIGRILPPPGHPTAAGREFSISAGQSAAAPRAGLGLLSAAQPPLAGTPLNRATLAWPSAAYLRTTWSLESAAQRVPAESTATSALKKVRSGPHKFERCQGGRRYSSLRDGGTTQAAGRGRGPL